jgi:hypothetical protein
MDPISQKPLRLFVNPLAIWTDLVLKSGEAMLASVVHAAAVRANAPKVAVIPAADPPPSVQPHAAEATIGALRGASPLVCAPYLAPPSDAVDARDALQMARANQEYALFAMRQ